MSDEDNPANPFIQTPSSHYRKHRFNSGEFFKSISVILIVLALFYAVFALRYDPLLTKNAYVIGAPAQAPAQATPTPPPAAPTPPPEQAQGGGDQGGDSNFPILPNPPVEAPQPPSGGGSSTQICAPCSYDGVCQACCSSDPDCPFDKNAAAQALKNKAGKKS